MMNLEQLLQEGRRIWGHNRLTLGQIIVRLGVGIGDLCRFERHADKDQHAHNDDEIKKEMGNIIFSTIRWCDDLGFDPQECVERAMEAQRKFAAENKQC